MGTGCTGRVPLGVFHWNPYSSLTGTLVFTGIQVGEFGVLGVYTSDSCTGSTYTSISGLHLIHVLGGTVLVGVSSGTGYSLEVVPGDTVPRDIYSIMEYSYWHLVEVVYIYIYLCLYYHYRDIPLYPLYPPPSLPVGVTHLLTSTETGRSMSRSLSLPLDGYTLSTRDQCCRGVYLYIYWC